MADAREGLIGKLTRARRAVALALLAAMAPVTVGCFGRFPLTRGVYKINEAMPTSILETVVFWAFLILPVYSGAMLIDAVILNLIEFWTGLSIPTSTSADEAGSKVVLEPSADGEQALLTVSKDGQVVTQVCFARVSDTVCEVRDSQGNLAGMAIRTQGGDLQLTDARGVVVQTITAAQLAQLRGG
ncbi:MAG: DUF3332 family protein [Planctomycetota bacterium]|jgi:hypothetical protein